jgi:hypothetical protein
MYVYVTSCSAIEYVHNKAPDVLGLQEVANMAYDTVIKMKTI